MPGLGAQPDGIELVPPDEVHQARLAAAAGERDAAIDAYRHYLLLRSDPEPALVAEVAQVREELNRLLAEPSER